MNKKYKPAPYIDRLILSCQGYPEIKNELNIKKLLSVVAIMDRLGKQGDDELRSIWITAERGEMEDFGDYSDFKEGGEVNSKKDFEELWKYYYPDKIRWYNFAVTKYADGFYFYIDSKLTFQFKTNYISESIYDFHTELCDWLLQITEININWGMHLKHIKKLSKFGIYEHSKKSNRI